MSRARAFARAAVERGYLLAALALALYIYLAPTAIVGGDNSEFAGLAALGGRAHPSGYPLYLIWLHLTSWLPGQTVAHTAAISTCVLAAAAVLALHAACRAWGARPLAATLASAMFAASPVVLIIHTEAEVFALNALIVSVILWLAGAGGPLRGGWRTVALAFVAALGMCDHMTCVLVAPVGLYGAWIGIRESSRRAPLVIAAAVGAFALGLTPYLQTLLAADSPSSWGASDGIGDAIHHFLRTDYGSAKLSANDGDPLPVASLRALAGTLARAWWWAPLALGLVTLGWRAVRPAGGPRAPWIALALTWLLAGPIFVSRFNIDPEGFGIHIVQRMHLLPCLLLAIPVAVGLDWIGRDRLARASAAWGLVAFPLFVAPSLSAAAAEHTPAVERSLVNTLIALPPNAALITNGDDFAFGIPYVQNVLGVRPDVIAITWPAVGFRWSLARLAARGVVYDPRAPRAPGDDVPSVRLADILNAAGHPVFVDDFAANILSVRPSYPYAGLIRVLPKGATPPGLDEIFAANAKAFAQFDLSYPPPGTDDGFMTVAHMRYQETWLRIAGLYRRAGFPEPADAARARADAIKPQD